MLADDSLKQHPDNAGDPAPGGNEEPEELAAARAYNRSQEIPYDPADYGLDDADDIRIYEHNRIRIDPGQEPIRLDQFLTDRLRISRSRIKSAALAGFVKVNRQPAKASYKVRPYDEVSIALPYPPEAELIPEDLPLDIPYEDRDLLLVDKPAGMVVHPGSGNFRGTLVNGLYYHLKYRQQPELAPEGNGRPGLVHRIDKDTSGLLVVAKHEDAFTELARQFYNRTTERRYVALVWGDVKPDQGKIVGHIGRSTNDRKRFRVYESGNIGKHAVTHFEVLKRFGICTLVRCKLETGRTHQIRVHFKYQGHTLFNDGFYGGNRPRYGKTSRAFQRFMHDCFESMPRQALHAKTLGFAHPGTRAFVHFSSPLPNDFATVLDKMTAFFGVEPVEDWNRLAEQPGYLAPSGE